MSVPPSSSTPAGPGALARFAPEIQAAHARFLATGDLQSADRVLLAIVRDFLPKKSGLAPGAPLPDDSRLIEDLGFDSLAIAEIVFFLEDLYQVRIAQSQLIELRCIGDLRNHLRTRLQGAQV